MEIFSIVVNVIICLGGPGLCDPCEKDAINACAEIAAQEAEDLTAAAQVWNYTNVHLIMTCWLNITIFFSMHFVCKHSDNCIKFLVLMHHHQHHVIEDATLGVVDLNEDEKIVDREMKEQKKRRRKGRVKHQLLKLWKLRQLLTIKINNKLRLRANVVISQQVINQYWDILVCFYWVIC